MDITRRNHFMCTSCKTEIGYIEMINGQMEMMDVLVICDTCKKVYREKDLVLSNTRKQGARFEKSNPFVADTEGC